MASKRLLKFRSSQLLLGLSAWKIPGGGNCQFVPVSKRVTLCCRNFSCVLIVVVSSKSNFTWVNSLAPHEQNSWQIENFWLGKTQIKFRAKLSVFFFKFYRLLKYTTCTFYLISRFRTNFIQKFRTQWWKIHYLPGLLATIFGLFLRVKKVAPKLLVSFKSEL